ncbi:MAG: radical SAM protein [Planctomycetes bacterium]|nr:radical SAM protein [Planctomycetota bacterium]
MYYLRVSLTDRCNLRCTYCLPENIRFAPDRASGQELRQLTDLIHQTVGVYKIRLTGGEPTLHPELSEFVRHARSITDIVGITSNGILLAEQLPELKEAGLNRVNISLDASNAEDFRSITRRDGFEKVIGAIRAAKDLGMNPVKVNTVAMRSTPFKELVELAKWEGFHLRFIELMAIGEALPWQKESYITSAEMRSLLSDQGISLQENKSMDEATSRIWTLPDTDPYDCSVGFITTTSDPFCSTCDRLRLSSSGKIFNCLMDNTGIDLLTPLRAGDMETVSQRIQLSARSKKAPKHFIRYENMAAIGG